MKNLFYVIAVALALIPESYGGPQRIPIPNSQLFTKIEQLYPNAVGKLKELKKFLVGGSFFGIGGFLLGSSDKVQTVMLSYSNKSGKECEISVDEINLYVQSTCGQVGNNECENKVKDILINVGNDCVPKFDYFWKIFKSAVNANDKVTVASFSHYPIGMSFYDAKIISKEQLIERYSEVFFNNDNDNVSQCFDKEKPVIDPSNPKQVHIYCESLEYFFKYTVQGWKFSGLDNINE